MNKKSGGVACFRIFTAFVAAVSFVSIFSACKTRHQSLPPSVKEWKKPEDKSAPDLQQLIYENSFKATSIAAKASVKSLMGDQENSFNINLRIYTDSLIWISISPLLGIEVARILVSKDTVKFIDRLNNKYSVSDYKLLNDLFKINIDFEIIQGVLTGNLFSYKKNKFNSVYIEERYYILSTLSKRNLKRSLEEMDLSKPVVQDMWVDGTSYRIIKLSIEDQRMNKSLNTDYSDHRETEGGLFPFRSNTQIKADQQIKIDIDFNRLNLNGSLEFPFNIPQGYEKIN